MKGNQNQGYEERYYRSLHKAKDLHYFHVKIKETDLAIGVDATSFTDSLVSLCQKKVLRLRTELEEYIVLDPEYQISLVPLEIMPEAPEIVVRMAWAAARAGVGPMAAVAGTFARSVGEMLALQVKDVIVENGGDIYLNSSQDRIIAIFAGKSCFSCKIGLWVRAGESPLGICTSSGTVGPSFSLGKADAAIIKARPAELADAVATQAGNLVQNQDDLMKAIDYAQNIEGVSGVLVIKDDRLAAWGDVEILPL
ncbi:MAG: UPF0280 family protein [Syntrophomonadaceae bacterium]|nr:UPF0280 family protein [Syntrophomonadaceae bacterium]